MMFRWHQGTLYLLVFTHIYNKRQTWEWSSKKGGNISAEDQLGGIVPGKFLDLRPDGWSEMTFMATHLSLCGKDKYFATHKNIK